MRTIDEDGSREALATSRQKWHIHTLRCVVGRSIVLVVNWT